MNSRGRVWRNLRGLCGASGIAGVCLPGVAGAAAADVSVRIEHLSGRGGGWNFDELIGPAFDHAGAFAVVTARGGGGLAGAGDAARGLTDGRISVAGDKPEQHVFFAAAETGELVMDLGRVIAVAAIHTYSWHEFEPDQGSRGPQVYGVSGRRGPGDAWRPVATVDTRPNETGEGWGGKHGVNISAPDGLGNFRYLRFEVEPTRSPLQRANPEWTHTFFSGIDVHTAESLASIRPARRWDEPSPVEEIIVVSKTHFDIGFTDMASKVVERYRTSMIDGALELVEASDAGPIRERFVWTVPGWPMKKILADWPGQSEERRRRIESAFRSGRIVTHALPYTIQTSVNDMEDLARCMVDSAEISRRFGLPLSRAAKMTDVPSHSWALVTLLAHSDVKFLHLGSNPASQVPTVPEMFHWMGPDGSIVLTYYSLNYGTGPVPPGWWPHKTWLALMMTGDNHGPPSPESVRTLLDRAAAEMPGAKVRFGTLDDFHDAIAAEQAGPNAPPIPVVEGDMPDGWIHGLGTAPVETAILRRTRPQIVTMDALHTILAGRGVEAPEVAARVAAAYADGMRFSEHTWGINSHYMSPKRLYGEEWQAAYERGDYQRWQESWEEKVEPAQRLAVNVAEGLRGQLSALAGAVEVDGKRVVVFNSLPWERGGLVTLNGGDLAGISALRDVESGKIVSLTHRDHRVDFQVSQVPAGGWRTFVSVEENGEVNEVVVDASELRIENEYFRVVADPKRGGIASIIEKKSGHELVDAGDRHPFGSYLYEAFGKADVQRFLDQYLRLYREWSYNDMGKRDLPDDLAYQSGIGANLKARIETGADRAAIILEGTPQGAIPHPFAIRIELFAGTNFIEITWEIDGKQARPEPEGGWLCLPFRLDGAVFRLGRSGGVTDPGSRIVGNTYRDLYAVQEGVAVIGDDGRGVAVSPLDTMLVSLDRPGLWRFSKDWLPERPRVFVNLYNNMWGTNYPQWFGGSWKSGVRLWTFNAWEPGAALIDPALETRQPLVAGVADGPGGTLPATGHGVALCRSGVRVGAFGADPHNEGVLLRLWEMAGRSSSLRVTLPDGHSFSRAIPCNLLGETIGEPFQLTNGVIETRIEANAPLSLQLE